LSFFDGSMSFIRANFENVQLSGSRLNRKNFRPALPAMAAGAISTR
jgi:hypothetical protein